jgi:hypothetical protein
MPFAARVLQKTMGDFGIIFLAIWPFGVFFGLCIYISDRYEKEISSILGIKD